MSSKDSSHPNAAQPAKAAESNLCAATLALFAFCITNIGLNEFNQWALKKNQWPGFEFPFFYTMFHMVTSALSSYLLAACVVKPALGSPSFAQLWEYKFGLLPLGILTFFSASLSNAGLTNVSLFVAQAIKATLPLPTVFFSWAFAGKSTPLIKLAVISCVCVGSVLAVWSNFSSSSASSDSIVGIIMVLISVLAAAMRPVIAMILMSKDSSRPQLEPTVVLVYDCGIAFVCMLITWLCKQDERERSIAYLADPSTRAIGWMIVAVGSITAFVFNLSCYYFVKLTSAVTVSLGGAGVKITLIIASAFQAGLHDPVSWTGVGIVIASLIAYSYLSMREDPKPTPPTQHEDPEKASSRAATERTPLNVKP